ncbi:hypothetical protein KCV06_g250, partial [Aureobasidium melanogenum]
MILDDWLNWYWLSSLDTLQWNVSIGHFWLDRFLLEMKGMHRTLSGGDSRLVISASVDVVALGGDSRRLLICILNDTVRKRCERLSRGKLRERATGGSGSSSSMVRSIISMVSSIVEGNTELVSLPDLMRWFSSTTVRVTQIPSLQVTSSRS